MAVVTGGARGIGRAIAEDLASKGVAVCVNYASGADAAEQVAAGIKNRGGRAIACRADVADVDAVKAMMIRAEAELGPLTILVNNAGLLYQATLETFDCQKFDRMRRVNVDGIIHTTRAAMTGMQARGYGRIINIASIAGLGTSRPGIAFYASTKAEVIVLTKRFALELGGHGITVNAVAPGFVKTDMAQEGVDTSKWEAIEKSAAERTMVRRIGKTSDISNAVTFLASPETGWITGQALVVDGGRMDYIGHG
ncbi:MAG TPA: glucose 1-dehydrogenase [Afipia sp.]